MARLWVLLAVLQATSAAWADQGRAAERAETLRRRAGRSYDLQDYERALADLREAYRLDPKPEFLYAIGQAERMSGDCARAIRSYQAFLRSGPPRADAERTRRNIATCEATVAANEGPTTTPTAPPSPPVPEPLPPPRPEAEPRSPWPGRLLLGGGLAVAAAGAVALAVGRSRVESANEASDYRTFDDRLAAARTGETLQIAGVAAMAVGGAVAGAGVAYTLWPASVHAVFHF